MNHGGRRQNNTLSQAARPAGLSDDEDNSSDDGRMHLSSSVVFPKKKNGLIKGSSSAAANENWEENGDFGQEAVATSEQNGNDGSEPDSDEYVEADDPVEALRFACVRGDLEKIDYILSDVNTTLLNQFFKDSKENPLITAALHGHSDVVEYLLEKKHAKPDLKHPTTKTTALMAIAGCEDEHDEEKLLKGVQALVNAGANVNFQDQFGKTALMIALMQKRRQIMEYLLKNGADPNLTDPDENTALMFAAMVGDGKSCRILLENKADIHLINNAAQTADEIARDKNHLALSDVLYTAKTTKWKPGLNPALMQEIDEVAIEGRRDPDICSIKEDGAIDLMLSAVDGIKYLENFRKHKINYVQFLHLNENSLKEIGVKEVGIRERILDNIKRIQNTQYQESSIKKIATNKNVTAAEAHCMVVNIREHLEYISSTLKYLHDRIRNKPLDLRYDMERHKIENILKVCLELDARSDEVRKDAVELYYLLGMLQGYTELQIAGKIPKRDIEDFKKLADESSSSKGIVKAALCIAGFVSVGYLVCKAVQPSAGGLIYAIKQL